jgi:hypothetical protein
VSLLAVADVERRAPIFQRVTCGRSAQGAVRVEVTRNPRKNGAGVDRICGSSARAFHGSSTTNQRRERHCVICAHPGSGSPPNTTRTSR